MAGTRLALVQKRAYDFGNVGVGATQLVSLAERIDVGQYIEGTLLVRVHALNVSGGTLSFDLYGDGHTAEDPGLSFRTASPLFASTPVSGTAPVILEYGGTARGSFASLLVSATRNSANPLSATVSVELVLKSPDDSD